MNSSVSANVVGSPRVLLVDDNRHGLIVRKALLEEIGCCVTTAATPEEALALCEAQGFRIVITDYRMPCMNGAQLIQAIRRHTPNIRVILLSGFVETLGLTERSTGADMVLAKTANEATHLIRAVKRLLQPAPVRKPPVSHARAAANRFKASGG